MTGEHDLGQLSLIGNCQIAMLPDRSGAITWGCWPRFDADPIFHSLLSASKDDVRGIFSIELVGRVSSTAAYRRNTAILETVLIDAQGNSIRIVDCCPRFTRFGRMFRPAMLIRRVECVSGRPLLRVRVRPAEGYGDRDLARRSGSHHISFTGELLNIRSQDGPQACVEDVSSCSTRRWPESGSRREIASDPSRWPHSSKRRPLIGATGAELAIPSKCNEVHPRGDLVSVRSRTRRHVAAQHLDTRAKIRTNGTTACWPEGQLFLCSVNVSAPRARWNPYLANRRARCAGAGGKLQRLRIRAMHAKEGCAVTAVIGDGSRAGATGV